MSLSDTNGVVLFFSSLTIIFLTILIALLRCKLFLYLKSLIRLISRLTDPSPDMVRGIQPSIITKLEQRYKMASSLLENINTVALVESIYGTEHTTIIVGISIKCEQAEYFCRSAPNLLLAFGLTGTFVGITFSLSSIANNLSSSSSTANINNLTTLILPQISGMSIAFISSLVALVCSSLITIINSIFNTNILRNRLIAYLEDYLDNIYKPIVQGDTRLDKSLKRMEASQTEFLVRFRENVGEVLERTFGEAARVITNESQETNKFAQNVYRYFLQSASSIAKSASTFEQCIQSLERLTPIIQNFTPQFKAGAEQFNDGVKSYLKAVESLEQNQIINNLESILSSLSQTHDKYLSTIDRLDSDLDRFIAGNVRLNQLIQRFVSKLSQTTQGIILHSTRFSKAIASFSESTQILQNNSLSEDFNTFSRSLQESSQTIKESLDDLKSLQNTINNSIAESVTNFENVVHEFMPVMLNLNQAIMNLEAIDSNTRENNRTILEQWDATTAQWLDFQNEWVDIRAHFSSVTALLESIKSILDKVENNKSLALTMSTNVENILRKLEEAIDHLKFTEGESSSPPTSPLVDIPLIIDEDQRNDRITALISSINHQDDSLLFKKFKQYLNQSSRDDDRVQKYRDNILHRISGPISDDQKRIYEDLLELIYPSVPPAAYDTNTTLP